MNLVHLPWLELSMVITLVGSACVSRMRDPDRASLWGRSFTGVAFACTLLAWLAFYLRVPPELVGRWSVQPYLFGRTVFGLDQLNAPLVPAVALLHFLTALATARTMMRRFSLSWSPAPAATPTATFCCGGPPALLP